jgi:hypothetical protein
VHEAKAAKAPLGGAQAADVGEHQLPGVTDDDVVDLPGAMNERAYLAPGLARSVEQRARELGRRDVLDGDAAPVDALERLDRLRGEPRLVAIDFDGEALRHRARHRQSPLASEGDVPASIGV